jgi:DNA-binding LytR/AlgR family response regulator
MTFFVALYLWLTLHRELHYFEVVSTSFKYLSLVLTFPYAILALSLRIYEYHDAANNPDESSTQRMRFYDEKHNLKIVLTPDSILYISAEQNYVTIVYNDNGTEREYTLRNSMKAIDEICQDNGLVRCHRSYYINPSYVRVLRKDKEGLIFAEMDSKSMIRIPVSKKFYSHLSDILC